MTPNHARRRPPRPTDPAVKRIVRLINLTLTEPEARALWLGYRPMPHDGMHTEWPAWFLCLYPTLAVSMGHVASLDILLSDPGMWGFLVEVAGGFAEDETEVLPEEGPPTYVDVAMVVVDSLDRIEHSYQLHRFLASKVQRLGEWDWVPWESLR